MIGVECLAVAIFFEARDQPLSGQFAVAEVVMNRVVDQRWPNTICDVVFQHRQFSFTHDGKSDRIDAYIDNIDDWKASVTAREIAYQVYTEGYTEMTSTHYHALSVSPSWADHYFYDGRIGDHVFYTAPVGK
jgi:spore germination cell wall hydrolase CwlJ-like protein